MKTKKTTRRTLAALLALCMTFTIFCGFVDHISKTAFVYAVSGISENAMHLRYDENVSGVIVRYLDGDNWIDITEDTESLPVNAGYQLEVWYHDINLGELAKSDYQMIYDDLPEWFVMSNSGYLTYNNEEAAKIEVIDGKTVINFYPEWVEKHSASGSLNGTFNLYGNIDWRNLPGNEADRKFPGLDFSLDFEDDLAQKYGVVDIEKSEPNLITGDDGKYYLEYEITVTSLDSIDLPDITVKDTFTNADYISGYVGIDSGIGGPEEFMPAESSDPAGAARGTYSKDGNSMIWSIGELKAGEVRTLKYYALISDDGYIDPVISNPIQNRAAVFSGGYQKDDDASFFVPRNTVRVQKNSQEAHVEPNGNGYIPYTVMISADDENSFVLNDLTFRDIFPDDLKGYLAGDNGAEITVTVNGKEQTVPYGDGSFEFSIPKLTPGEKITVEYKIYVKNIFLYNNGEVSLTNTASVNKNDRTLHSGSDTSTLQKVNSARKIYGSAINGDLEITMETGDDVYSYNGNSIVSTTNPGEFTVPSGSHKYDIILNESGSWDMSSTTMKDSFGGNEHIVYTGYVQIRLYENRDEEYSGSISDSALLKELEDSSAVKTIWLKVDGKNDFTFTPKDLGVDENTTYTYLLTYYAEPIDMEDIGSMVLTNQFELWGEIGDGNGGHGLPFPGITVSTGNIIQGKANYDAEKIGWYYELPGNVYRTEASTSGAYPDYTAQKDGFLEQYATGALYWVIRLEGNIGSGSHNGKYGTSDFALSGFKVIDEPSGSFINRDAVVGIFKGSKSFDFTQYASYAEFMEDKFPDGNALENDKDNLISFNGNSRNDQWFHSAPTMVENPDYYWGASNTKLNGIVFTKAHELNDDEAIFIVFRTAPYDNISKNDSASRTWTNTLSIDSGGGSVPINTASITYHFKGSLFKESKGAYIFNKDNKTFTNCSDKVGGDWNVNTVVGPNNLDSSGTYATWLLNINWDGSMSGEAYVSDFLPEGMELMYVEVNNFGSEVIVPRENWATTDYIGELAGDPDWVEMVRKNTITVRSFVGNNTNAKDLEFTTISYYNPETREIRWHIKDLISGSYKEYQINLRIICKVVDPELFLSGVGKTYENNAAIWDSETESYIEWETADVTINRKIDKNLDAAALNDLNAAVSGNSIKGQYNRLPFKLEINPAGEDMSDGEILPPLIDELSEHLMLLENTLKVTKADGTEYTAFTYTVEEINGCQRLIIKDLPDNTPLTITYEARINAVPNSPVNISNTAYWAGNDPPKEPQVKDKEFQYDPSGSVFISNNISIEIIKVDSASHSKRLQGAVFEIYEADGNGNQIGDVIATGTTDSYGTVIFTNKETGHASFNFNTIYCIREVTPPSGYKPDLGNGSDRRYFIIMDAKLENAPVPDHTVELDVWYDSPNYSCDIPNDKGTISVNKVFVGSSGNYIPDSGSYRFGLYDGVGKLVEMLTIEYGIDDETQQHTVKYYLDGVQKSSPDFTKFEPTGRYYVYELDESGTPIENNGTFNIEETVFKVTYGTDGSNEVYANCRIRIRNSKELGAVQLPASGGIGLVLYYLVGALLALISLTFIAVQLVLMKKRRTGSTM